ncbi:MFS transporter [Verticiella sediminum]|uniref:MFS transporter n=1 Tax=Verticiella sediminum TaxID=1247510 RepID=A0A556AVR7_9BURK|nr:MFS transporter [Verticiella sediminum]TSH97049.1 MFS transporter [Verticiella sediminum]
MPQPVEEARTGGARMPVLAIFFSFAAAYLLSYGLRSVNAALAPYLSAELGLSPTGLGGLSAVYFAAFAALQWPLGHWLDRYGARRINAGLLLVAALGAAILAASTNLATAAIGRALIGAGVAACLMAPMSYFRRCFAPEQQARFSLWILVSGTSGAVVATLPAEALAAALGWRSVFALAALLLLLAAAAIFRYVQDRDLVAGGAAREDGVGAGALLRHPRVVPLAPMALLGHGGAVALLTLWAGPWMVAVFGMDNAHMARALMVLMLTLMGCYVGMSFVTPWLQRRGLSMMRIGIAGHVMMVPVVLAIGLLGDAHTWWVWLLLAFAFPSMSLVQPALAQEFPKAVAGRILTLYNLFIFVGAFAMQWSIGLAIELLARLGVPLPWNYRLTAVALGLIQIGCLAWYASRRRRALIA